MKKRLNSYVIEREFISSVSAEELFLQIIRQHLRREISSRFSSPPSSVTSSIIKQKEG